MTQPLVLQIQLSQLKVLSKQVRLALQLPQQHLLVPTSRQLADLQYQVQVSTQALLAMCTL